MAAVAKARTLMELIGAIVMVFGKTGLLVKGYELLDVKKAAARALEMLSQPGQLLVNECNSS